MLWNAGPPRPPLGLGPSGTLPHAAGPPARWADCTPGPRLSGAPGLRRPLPRSSLARSPARPEPLQPPRAAFLPSAPSPSFAAAGAELGKPAPAAGERRELKQETRSQGGNPGGVERVKFAFVAPVSSAPIPIASLSFEEVPAESILPRIPREKRAGCLT
ncbi:synapsin-1-like [Microtus oregoni]|uniref:synapsin-1-like n=1 Tax=Microtus oregoni TaxID=111838 RepID=UPI001BB15A91|nr:synapsin-1-like [Microtus oregoni]